MSNYFFRPELRDLTKGARLELIKWLLKKKYFIMSLMKRKLK